MAGADQLQRIGAQEGVAHDHLRAVGRDEVRVLGKGLDEAENIVPASAVEPGHMVAQLVDDLVHFERCRQGFDQHGCLDGTLRDPQVILRKDDDLVPQPGFKMVLHLRQVEIGAGALRDRGLGAVEHIEPEVEQGARHDLTADRCVALIEAPAARPDLQHGRCGTQAVRLAVRRIVIGQRACPAVLQVDLAVDAVREGRRIGVLEIGHEDLGA